MRALGLSKDPVDLTGDRGESFSQDATSSSPRTNAPTAAEACDSLQQFLSSYNDSSEEDGAPPSELPPSTEGPSSHPAPGHCYNHDPEGVARADHERSIRRNAEHLCHARMVG